MRPVLLHRGRLVLHSYTAMLYVGLVVGTFVGSLVARKYQLDPDRFGIATVSLLVPGLVGSRLWFVLEHRSYFREAPDRIWRHSEGGAGLYGGLIAALAVSPAVLTVLGLPIGRFWDATCFTLLIGAIFTRVGCLLAGCCAGRPTHLRIALRLPDREGKRLRRYPTQLLEMGLAGGLLVAALLLRSEMQVPGELLICVLGAYGVGRFFLDFSRDSTANRTTLSAAQIVSLALAGPVIPVVIFGGV
jgi:phosphatidylglycerol:prolipoprotein diacylglycerol transferase